MGAFIDLLLERGYEKVSVADLVERANVGRSTFYAHYGGIDGMLSQSLARPAGHLAAIVDGPPALDQVIWWLSHFKDQRRRNRAFFASPVRGVWARTLAELIEPRLAGLIRANRLPPPPLPLGLIAAQLAEGQLALIDGWLTLRPTAPAEAIAKALVATVQANLTALIGWSPGRA